MTPTQTLKLMKELAEQHGLSHWNMELDDAKRRFGLCDRGRMTISISRHLAALNTEAEIRNTVLHELAHAKTPGAHHNRLWKATARAMGCTGTRCYSAEVIQPARPYRGQCPNCQRVIERHRRKSIACSTCCAGKGFNPAFRFVWSRA